MQEKLRIVSCLTQPPCSGSYAEAAIILCGILSAFAAEMWPGKGIDKKRFIELLVRCGTYRAYLRTISVPLLVADLELAGEMTDARTLRATFHLNEAQVFTGIQVDASEEKLVSLLPNMTLEKIRTLSYAHLLYDDVRSSYAHEYGPGAKAGSRPMARQPDAKVSYINRLNDNDRTIRLIHFHMNFLADLVSDLASALDSEPTLPRAHPTTWWMQGAP